eukprot:4981327-Amphidinium_carterae.2
MHCWAGAGAVDTCVDLCMHSTIAGEAHPRRPATVAVWSRQHLLVPDGDVRYATAGVTTPITPSRSNGPRHERRFESCL